MNDFTDMTIYERIEIALDRTKKNQSQLAEALGHADSSVVSKALKNAKGLERHWDKIAAFFGVTMDWIVTGKGDPPIVHPDHYPSVVKDSLVRMSQRKRGHVSVPIIGEVTAGHGESWITDADPDDEGGYKFDRASCLVRVHGASGGSVIRDGQLALLAPIDRKPKSGDIVAVQTNDKQSYVKRLSIDVRHHRLILTNVDPSAEGESLTLDDDEVGVMRVVIGCLYE